jgi:hypothetical protein
MGSFDQIYDSLTPVEGSRTPNSGSQTPITCRSLSRHPSSVLLTNMPPPSPRWNDGTTTPRTMVSSGPATARGSARVSRRNSLTSMRSHQSFSVMEDMKHEVMVNYLFQQQCGKMWIGDVSGEIEGVVIRKSRGVYQTCPPPLSESPFAEYCRQMNVQVRTFLRFAKVWP